MSTNQALIFYEISALLLSRSELLTSQFLLYFSEEQDYYFLPSSLLLLSQLELTLLGVRTSKQWMFLDCVCDEVTEGGGVFIAEEEVG